MRVGLNLKLIGMENKYDIKRILATLILGRATVFVSVSVIQAGSKELTARLVRAFVRVDCKEKPALIG